MASTQSTADSLRVLAAVSTDSYLEACATRLVLVPLVGFGLHAYTVRHIARTAVLPNVEVVSAYPMAATGMRQLASRALSESLS